MIYDSPATGVKKRYSYSELLAEVALFAGVLVEQGVVKGDRVIVDEGSLDGWEGVFYEELPDRDRVTILLTSMGFTGKMTVSRDKLIKKS